jgi:hypothetical protein
MLKCVLGVKLGKHEMHTEYHTIQKLEIKKVLLNHRDIDYGNSSLLYI